MNTDTNFTIPYPAGLMRILFRLPIQLYKVGLGGIVGWTPYMVVTTCGRKSGTPRHAVLEYRRHGSKYYVISGWGARPDWYQNLMQTPLVTIQQGRDTFGAQATPVSDLSEALRVLVMFRRSSPIAERILLSMSSAESLDLKTLQEVAGEFTIVRFNPIEEKPTLPGIDAVHGWMVPLILAALLLILILSLARSRTHTD